MPPDVERDELALRGIYSRRRFCLLSGAYKVTTDSKRANAYPRPSQPATAFSARSPTISASSKDTELASTLWNTL